MARYQGARVKDGLVSDRSTRNRVDSILQDDGKAVTEPQRPGLKDSVLSR